MKALALAALMLAWPLHAQQLPIPGPGDPRLQLVSYDANQVVRLEVATGYHLTVMFAPDERIESVAIGDSGAWEATANKRGDYLFLKPLQAGANTNLTVITDARVYAFELLSVAGGEALPYTVRFTYPTPLAMPSADPALKTGIVGRYRLSGARALRPSAISDDGNRTFIEWATDTALPAVYALDDRGQEVLADGDMIEDRYVLPKIHRRLRFRLGRQTAHATRLDEDK